jgi:hypothetical protein
MVSIETPEVIDSTVITTIFLFVEKRPGGIGPWERIIGLSVGMSPDRGNQLRNWEFLKEGKYIII